MTMADRRGRLVSVLHTTLGGKASAILLERLTERFSGCPDDEKELKERIDKTRMAVRMFVSEELGDEVHRRLLAEAGLPTTP
jgi:hypothetical protein